jgi:hypothetical protein
MSFGAPKIQTPRPPPKPAATPTGPSMLSTPAYNPFSSPFQQFRMSPYLTRFAPKKAGRPTLIAQRNG